MQSNDRAILGRNHWEVIAADGTRTTGSTDAYCDYTWFTVSNGLVQGDKRTPNPVYFSKTRTHSMKGTKLYRRTGTPMWSSSYEDNDLPPVPWSLSLQGNLFPFSMPRQNLEERALQRIYDQMRYGSGNLVVDLAEAGETIKMIKNATSVRKLVRQFMKEVVKPSGPASSKRLKYATDKWLEYRYGWLPFLSSTYELLETLSRKVNKATLVPIEGRAVWTNEWIEHDVMPGFATSPYRSIETVQQSSRILIKARMRGRTTLELYDFTSLNPALIAWELVPLSFVADWFANVGQCLSLWEDHILFANRFVDGFETATIKEEVIFEHDEIYSRQPPYYWPSGSAIDGYLVEFSESRRARRSWRYKNRWRLESLPTPGGVRIEVKLNAKRLLDAAALIRGSFGNPRVK